VFVCPKFRAPTRAGEGDLIDLVSETAAYDETFVLTVHDPHSPTMPVIKENTVDNVPIPAVLYAENDIRSDAPVIGVSSGWENWRRLGSSVT